MGQPSCVGVRVCGCVGVRVCRCEGVWVCGCGCVGVRVVVISQSLCSDCKKESYMAGDCSQQMTGTSLNQDNIKER